MWTPWDDAFMRPICSCNNNPLDWIEGKVYFFQDV
jgi:hypothetical protein